MSPYATGHTHTSYWEGPSRWINTALLVIIGFIGLDTLLRLLGANEANGIVSFVRAVSGVFLAPFRNMFPEQQYLLTALIAILGWSLLAALVLAIVRSLGGDRERVVHREHVVDGPADPDPTRRL